MQFRISSLKLRKSKFILRRVVGESMLPTLKPGELLLGINTKRIMPGDIVIVNHNGLDKVKRVKEVNKDSVYILGDNPKKSSDSRDFGFIDRSKIIARVIWPIFVDL